MNKPTLREYISQIGSKNFAELFGIPVRVAESYRYGARRPRPDLAYRIVQKTPVTWEGIYAPPKKDEAK